MIQQALITEQTLQSIRIVGIREQYRDRYWLKRDPKRFMSTLRSITPYSGCCATSQFC
jgi:hypothetical protein